MRVRSYTTQPITTRTSYPATYSTTHPGYSFPLPGAFALPLPRKLFPQASSPMSFKALNNTICSARPSPVTPTYKTVPPARFQSLLRFSPPPCYTVDFIFLACLSPSLEHKLHEGENSCSFSSVLYP